MNRAERRHPDKAKATRVREILKDINTIHKIKAAMEGGCPFQPGDKVMLNLDSITRRPDYNKLLPAYKEFCEKNAGRIFTVEYGGRKNPSIVCLAEDESTPKWLFWVGDLKAVES